METIKSCLKWLLCILVTVPTLTASILCGLFSFELSFKIYSRWGKLCQKIFGLQIEIVDLTNTDYDSENHIFVLLNQTSKCEMFIFAPSLPRPVKTIAAAQFAAIPFFGWVYFGMGASVIIQKWRWQARKGIEKAQQHLRSGYNFAISIEGKRSKDGKLCPYKKGTAVLAIETQKPIIPLIVTGARDAMPFGNWKINPRKITITMYPPVPTRGLSYEDRDKLTESLRNFAVSKGCVDTAPA